MKPVAFAYEAPATVDEALALLGARAAVALAGGQSLVPQLNFRACRPRVVVDLNGVEELSFLRESDGALRIGALARQAEVERSRVVAEGWPLLAAAVRRVGHPGTRSRGTVAGSVAFADPRAALPVCLAALDARYHTRSPRGSRVLRADELQVGAYTTALAGDELLVEIEVPRPAEGARMSWCELSRTHGDFPTAGAAVVAAPGQAAIALLGAGETPVRAVAAEPLLADGAPAAEVGRVAARDVEEDYRRALVAELVRRAVEEVRG